MKITALKAREILDSRGVPTVETTIELDNRITATAAVPSGASTGATEVVELRDNDPNRYFGQGVLKAVNNVNNVLAPELIGEKFLQQSQVDDLMIEIDGTPYKSKLGGNAILSISMAYARATAMMEGQELYEYFGQLYWGGLYDPKLLEMPQPMILIMEGGKHGNWATDIQEYMIVPRREKFETFSDALRAGAEIFKATHDILVKKGYSGNVGYEGAFAPSELQGNQEAFEIIMQGIEVAGYRPRDEIVLATDIAASEFFDYESQRYILRREDSELTADEWVDLQAQWIDQFPLWSIEDPLHEEDWDNWQKYTQRFGEDLQIVGDDNLTTNVERIQRAIEEKTVNSVLIKLNQIGTVSETIDAIRVSTEAGFTTVISHRSGETNDDIIADLVVGTPSGQCKFGGTCRGERLAKYNRLTEIEALLK